MRQHYDIFYTFLKHLSSSYLQILRVYLISQVMLLLLDRELRKKNNSRGVWKILRCVTIVEEHAVTEN